MIGDLAHALRAEGGLLADYVTSDGEDPEPTGTPARLAASGPRTAMAPGEYELLLEMVLEGTLLHYGSGRVVEPDDPDLALLLGDRLYALGLGRLAAIGDLDAISVLADVIAGLAQAHAEGEPERVGAIWERGARKIGWGTPS